MEEEQNNASGMEYLKQLIIQQIKSQQEANLSFNKILHRLTFVLIVVSAMTIGGIIFIIYTENKPVSILKQTLQTAKDLETRISLQREYINMNTKDITKLKDSSKNKYP